jgi:hypothetical protein
MTSDKTGKRICVIHLMTMPPPPNALDKTATPRPQLPTTFAAPSLRSVASSVTMVSPEDIIESSKEESSSSSSSHITTSPHALPSSTSPRAPLPALLAFTALNLAIFLVALDTVLIPTALPTIFPRPGSFVCLDRVRLPARERRIGAAVGQAVRHIRPQESHYYGELRVLGWQCGLCV